MTKTIYFLACTAALLAGCALPNNGGDAPKADSGDVDEARVCYQAAGCQDVPRCPDADAGSCYLEADGLGRLIDLWTCPPGADVTACAAAPTNVRY